MPVVRPFRIRQRRTVDGATTNAPRPHDYYYLFFFFCRSRVCPITRSRFVGYGVIANAIVTLPSRYRFDGIFESSRHVVNAVVRRRIFFGWSALVSRKWCSTWTCSARKRAATRTGSARTRGNGSRTRRWWTGWSKRTASGGSSGSRRTT